MPIPRSYIDYEVLDLLPGSEDCMSELRTRSHRGTLSAASTRDDVELVHTRVYLTQV